MLCVDFGDRDRLKGGEAWAEEAEGIYRIVVVSQ